MERPALAAEPPAVVAPAIEPAEPVEAAPAPEPSVKAVSHHETSDWIPPWERERRANGKPAPSAEKPSS